MFAFVSAPADKKANTFPVAALISRAHLLLCAFALFLCALLMFSVGWNGITGDAADNLAKVVLEHAIMTDFCGIPLVSLRENSITELNLERKGVGVPGAIVLSKLLPAATALTSLKCAASPECWQFLCCSVAPKAFAFLSAPLNTPVLSVAVWQAISCVLRPSQLSLLGRSTMAHQLLLLACCKETS